MEYITADHHFYHTNIIKYCDRPFKSTEEMNETMIDRWNRVVSKSDTVYHLGDFALATREQIKELLDRLNGYKILIRGNHDKGKKLMGQLGFDKVYNSHIKYKGNILSHRPFKSNYKLFNVCVEMWNYFPIKMPKQKGLLIHGHVHNDEVKL